MKEYQLAVFIGRCQPVHNSHLKIIRQGLEVADKVLILMGSYRATPSTKNPFTFEQRRTMLLNSLTKEEQWKVEIFPLRDFYGNDSHWVTQVQNIVSNVTEDGGAICKLGCKKDRSSFYLDYFPDWDWIPPVETEPMDATTIRKTIFEHPDQPELWEVLVPKGTADFIKNSFIKHHGFHDGELDGGYNWLVNEYEKIKEHKKLWASAPYPPSFNTADAVVIQSGHVLLVKRKFAPGKGLWALPGVYKKVTETYRQAALRELKEETGIRVDKRDLDRAIVDEKCFDHPGRSQMGCIITTVFAIKLPDGKLAEVRGADDAEKAIWMNFNDVNLNEDMFHDDHVHIIRWAMGRV